MGASVDLDPISRAPDYFHPYLWTHKEEDTRVTAHLSGVLRDIKDEALQRGVFTDYVYMNYASEYQDVISRYGIANKDKLKKLP
ncbi:uncharacterized protein PG986_002828 [Apiospora aurea]|uniref:Uncharacterized protein n=1 Tax=Apiospora aurea TaxID=335848 RepID=A0ABR1QPY1_9PEZI